MLTGGLDQTFTRTDAMGARHLLTDGLGSTLELTDATGSETIQYTYEPFGQTSASGATSGNSSQYTGRENDGTGLYYYRARYYSPTLQRFINEDPIGFAGGDINLYAYVFNNPENSTDPSGLQQRSDRDRPGDQYPGMREPYKPGTPNWKEFWDGEAPDYVALNFCIGFRRFKKYAGWAGQVVISKDGEVYIAPLGGAVAAPAGNAVSLTVGYINGAMRLRRYWFEFEISGDDLRRYVTYSGLKRGCGVTAHDYEDARVVLSEQIFRGDPTPQIRRVVEDVNVSTLDEGHVLPNIGVPNVERGLVSPPVTDVSSELGSPRYGSWCD